MNIPDTNIERQMRELVVTYRARCLWFLKEDYFPTTPGQMLRVLRYIERYGDRDAFIKSRRLQQWLSRNSSAESAS